MDVGASDGADSVGASDAVFADDAADDARLTLPRSSRHTARPSACSPAGPLPTCPASTLMPSRPSWGPPLRRQSGRSSSLRPSACLYGAAATTTTTRLLTGPRAGAHCRVTAGRGRLLAGAHLHQADGRQCVRRNRPLPRPRQRRPAGRRLPPGAAAGRLWRRGAARARTAH